MVILIALMEVMRLLNSAVSYKLGIFINYDLKQEVVIFSDCCELVVVKYTENNTEAYLHHSSIFTTYKMESGTVNERSHYTSHNGTYALEYVHGCGWMIQSPEKRYISRKSGWKKSRNTVYTYIHLNDFQRQVLPHSGASWNLGYTWELQMSK